MVIESLLMSIKGCFSREQMLEDSISFKRLFDITISLLLILFTLPLCILISLLIKITSQGPIFYCSKRVGKDSRSFTCFKFRTMHPEADKTLKKILECNSDLKKEWMVYFKLKKDPRVTSLGKFLRKTSLDELPQLWNVLKGDLSLVGPRPYLAEEMHKMTGIRAGKILSVRPGLTGLWQVSGRNNLPFFDRLRLDEEYISKRSFGLDFVLLCKTIPVVFFAKGQ